MDQPLRDNPLLVALLQLAFAPEGRAAPAARADALPDLGAAPPFSLTTQEGAVLSLQDLRGKVVVLAFLSTASQDVCLAETAQMAAMQRSLGADFATRVRFVAVTLDPEHASGQVLEAYARSRRFGARLDGWTFLTGSTDQVREVARHYGVVFRKGQGDEGEHNTRAAIIDARGHLRARYPGVKVGAREILADIRRLLAPDPAGASLDGVAAARLPG